MAALGEANLWLVSIEAPTKIQPVNWRPIPWILVLHNEEIPVVGFACEYNAKGTIPSLKMFVISERKELDVRIYFITRGFLMYSQKLGLSRRSIGRYNGK